MALITLGANLGLTIIGQFVYFSPMNRARIFQSPYFLVLILLFSGHESIAQQSVVMIQPDIRIFTVLGALRAAGFDEALLSVHPAGRPIAREFQALPAALKEKLRNFYESHRRMGSAEEQLTKYVSLAFSIEGPPEFKPLLSLGQLPPDAWSVVGFADLLREFYSAANIEIIWSRYKDLHEQAIWDYRPLINRIIMRTEGYLRMSADSYQGRRLVFVLDYLVPPNTFNARTYQSNYYFLFGPSESPKTSEIRHQYLHFLLDPLSSRYPLPVRQGNILNQMMFNQSEVTAQSSDELKDMITESLIKAVEMRLDRLSDSEAEISLNEAIRSGAGLVRHFFEKLQVFEKRKQGFSMYYRHLLEGIDTTKIKASLDLVAKTTTRSRPKESRVSESENIIRQGFSSLGSSQFERAEELFNIVLNRYDRQNGEAFYGLGVVAVNRHDKDSAKEFFEKAVTSKTSPGAVRVWTHIYLGRLFDLEENRKEAILHYQAALEVGDDTRNAQTIAQRGLKEPFNPRPTVP